MKAISVKLNVHAESSFNPVTRVYDARDMRDLLLEPNAPSPHAVLWLYNACLSAQTQIHRPIVPVDPVEVDESPDVAVGSRSGTAAIGSRPGVTPQSRGEGLFGEPGRGEGLFGEPGGYGGAG